MGKIVDTKNMIIWMIIFIVIIFEWVLTCGLSALENITETDLRRLSEEQEKKAKKIISLKDKIDDNRESIPFFMTLLNSIVGVVCIPKIVEFVQRELKLEIPLKYAQIEETIVFIVVFFLVVYLLCLIGNVIPAKLALKHSMERLKKLVNLLEIFLQVMKPFNWMLKHTTCVLFKIMGKNANEYQDSMTEEAIISVVNEGLEQGILENSEVEMISNIIEMDEKVVRDIMTRRQKIVALDGNLTVEEAIKVMMEKSYSRFPVYIGDIDNIVGIVFWKDITKYYIQHNDKTVLLSKLVKKPYMVPDTQKMDLLFEEMQLKKIHMAIAIDEYGQTAGIVAMEDVLEEIVGNIFDEFDVDEKMIMKQRDGKYFMRGLTSLEDVEKELGIDMTEELEDYDTLNGLLVSKLGHIPGKKEKVDIIYKGYEFHIIDVKDKMIRFVRVHKI
ncbi:MAG: DUF21 domain-containing protein [Lachnospiraceae bacterium]|nr:DUF21 domain-containing protein [Lachnospiraceae bacterium]